MLVSVWRGNNLMEGFRRVLTVGTALNGEIRKSLVALVHWMHFERLFYMKVFLHLGLGRARSSSFWEQFN